jgi:hypothetical protein
MAKLSKNQNNKKTRKGTKSSIPASSDMSVSAGRGHFIPRAGLGRDTLLGIAQSQRRTLAYSVPSQLISTSDVYVEAALRLNDAFAPYGAGSAAGYAKYMQFYSKAWVLGARLVVTGTVVNSVDVPTFVHCTVTTNSTSFAGIASVVENGMCDYRVIGTNPDHFVLKQAVDVARFMNIPKLLDVPTFASTAIASPLQFVDAHIGMQGFNVTGSPTMNFVIDVEYDVVFTDPIPFT